MATVVKDFKVKAGLIVEGTTAKVNNFDILTKSTSDQNYIIGLIGGSATSEATPDTVVLRDENADFAANMITSDLTGDVTGTVSSLSNHDTADLAEGTNLYFTDARALTATALAYDAAGSAEAAEQNANSYTDGRETAITEDYEAYADQAELDAIAAAESYTDGRETAITTAYQTYADQAETDAKAYTDTRETAITTAYRTYADQAETDAKAYTDTRETAITTAYQAYADQAEADAKTFATEAIADLVDSAPATLDTLNELAAALQDNPDIISDLQDIAAGKQDTLTAGANIDITGDTISVTGLTTADVAEDTILGGAYFTETRAKDAVAGALGDAIEYESGAFNVKVGDGLEIAFGQVALDRVTVDGYYDANGAAATAEQNAKDYADALDTDDVAEGTTNKYFTNQRAIDAVGDTIDNAINALDTDDIEEGATNLYFTSARAKTSAAELLTGATLTNITITGTGSGLTITAENGVADSDTDDLDEGTENLYFTNTRAVDALEAVVPNFTEVEVNSVAKQVASKLNAAPAGVLIAHAWAKADYRSAEFLVKVAYGTHTEISKVLLTLDTSDNIAITEYGIVGTNGSVSTVSATISGTDVQLLVTTNNNSSTVAVVGTLLA